ncbi:MAG: hypothetical protein HZB45_19245 [Mycolicibacterium rufum]|nr:hypothetical protein [Mycolicibacterium rufum]
MNAGSYVGRIGGLAVALGVGAAVFTGHGVAYASTDTDSSASGGASGTSGTSGTTSASESSTTSGTQSTGKSGSDTTSSDKGSSDKPDTDTEDTGTGTTTGKKDRHTLWSDLFGGHKPKPGAGTDDPDATPDPSDGTDETPSGGTDETPQQGADDPAEAVKTPPKKPRWSWKPAEESTSTSTDDTGTVDTTPTKKPLKSLLASITVDAPETTKTASTLVDVSTAAQTPETTTAEVPTDTAEASTTPVSQGPLATLFKRFLDIFSGNAPASPAANSPFAWVAAAASRRELAAAQTDDPTMYWNGYEVVPVGEPTITQFYGSYTMVPAFPGIVQGTQDFDLVDENGATVATIHGLVTYNNDVGSGNRLLQILVTDADFGDGVEYGTDFKDIPRPGSVFASVSNGKYGNVYSALDNLNGDDVVTYKFVTSSFSLPLNPDPFRIKFSSADFLYDNEGVNRPIYTQDGYYIKPISNTTPWTAYAAYQPLFNAIQGANTFGVYDAETDDLIGTFEGVVTVTSDFWGTTSEAILVTEAEGDLVGVGAGQIPPKGTIYNIIYWTEDPGDYLLYYAKPDARPNSNVIKTILVDTKRSGRVDTLDLQFRFDAAAPPVRTSLDVPGRNGTGYSLKPVGELQYSGVNGLPPREAIVQGYQQYEVYDSAGKYLGKVNADVTKQWNLAGNSSEAVLVTGIVDVAEDSGVGPEAGKVPPVGSVFNFSYTGTTGFGEAYYALPTDSGKSKISFQYVTPFGGIPAFKNYDAAKELGDYNYYSPFDGNQNFNLLSASGAESGALLGASQPLCVLDGSTCEV